MRVRLSRDKRVSAQIELITYSHADAEVRVDITNGLQFQYKHTVKEHG